MRKKRKCLLLLLVFSILILSFSVPVFAKTKINKKSATLHVGETVQLKVTGTKSKVKWSSSDKKTANVTKQGLVKAKKAGKTTITAKVGKKIFRCRVTILAKEADTIVHLEKQSIRYENYNRVFDLTISIKGNNLIIQGKLKHIDSYGNSSLYHSTKNVFILSPETKYWQSDMTVSKEKFLGMAQQAIGKQWPWFILDMKDGKVASVGFTER